MEETIIDPSQRWPDYKKLIEARVNGFDGQSLADHVKELQTLERGVLQSFEQELAKIDPTKVTPETLKLIDGYNNILTQIDLAHREATEHYGSLTQQEKNVFMHNYLPLTADKTLFDTFITKASPSRGNSEQQRLSQLAFQSDVLKLLATPDGYQNLKQLDNFLNANIGKLCAKIAIVLRDGAISQTYLASRDSSNVARSEETFVTPESLLFDVPLPKYIEQARSSVPTIQQSDLKTSTKINTGVDIQLHFPFPENLNKAILKIGRDSETGNTRFIYSPRFVSLHHEFNHTVRMFKGINLEWTKSPASFKYVYKNMEEFAVIQVESALRKHLGLAQRVTHSGITYDPTAQDALKKFQEAAIDMYFKALVEAGVIPEKVIDMDPQALKDLKVDSKLNFITTFLSIQREQQELHGQSIEHSSWTSIKSNPKFEDIKSQTQSSQPLARLIEANLLDIGVVKNNLLTAQEIKNLSNPVIQDAILMTELEVDFVKKLSDPQVERIVKATGSTRTDVIQAIQQEISSKKTEVQTSTTNQDLVMSSEKENPKIQSSLQK